MRNCICCGKSIVLLPLNPEGTDLWNRDRDGNAWADGWVGFEDGSIECPVTSANVHFPAGKKMEES
jgi:hypothetical protein